MVFASKTATSNVSNAPADYALTVLALNAQFASNAPMESLPMTLFTAILVTRSFLFEVFACFNVMSITTLILLGK